MYHYWVHVINFLVTFLLVTTNTALNFRWRGVKYYHHLRATKSSAVGSLPTFCVKFFVGYGVQIMASWILYCIVFNGKMCLTSTFTLSWLFTLASAVAEPGSCNYFWGLSQIFFPTFFVFYIYNFWMSRDRKFVMKCKVVQQVSVHLFCLANMCPYVQMFVTQTIFYAVFWFSAIYC